METLGRAHLDTQRTEQAGAVIDCVLGHGPTDGDIPGFVYFPGAGFTHRYAVNGTSFCTGLTRNAPFDLVDMKSAKPRLQDRFHIRVLDHHPSGEKVGKGDPQTCGNGSNGIVYVFKISHSCQCPVYKKNKGNFSLPNF